MTLYVTRRATIAVVCAKLLEVNGLTAERPSQWPGPNQPGGDPRDYAASSDARIAVAHRPPRRRRLWWVISVLVVAAVATFVAYPLGYNHGERDYKAGIEALASAAAAQLPPADLYCPDPNSEDARKAIRELPVVVIDWPPAERVLIMRRGVVVVVKADLAVDLVVCGNDARLVLEKTPRPSARILMQGGTDTRTKGAGPMVFTVDAAKVNPDRVWFSNRNPQIVPCYVTKAAAPDMPRACSSYYATTVPKPSVSVLQPSPSPSRSK